MIAGRLEKPRALPSTRVAGRRLRLTKREQQIVVLIRRGSTNREIAKKLGTTERTVKNQPVGANGDWVITGPLSVSLRAERLGSGTGRVYTIGISCTDTSGNTSSGTTTVTVAHDQGR